MPDRFAEIAPRAVRLVRMLASNIEFEVVLSVRALLQLLTNVNLTINAIADRLEIVDRLESEIDRLKNENKPFNAAEMQALYDKGYQEGHAAGVEYGRKSAVLAGVAPLKVFHAGTGVNGYTWKEIAEHCVRNSHLFIGKDLEFVESVARQVQYKDVSPPQASWLHDLFIRRCGGKI